MEKRVTGGGGGEGDGSYNCLAPKTSPVLQPPHTATRLITYGTAGTDWQVPLQPLMGHGHLRREDTSQVGGSIYVLADLPPHTHTHFTAGTLKGGPTYVQTGTHLTQQSFQTYPILILDDVISYGSQRGPFAVVGGSHSTTLVGFELAN